MTTPFIVKGIFSPGTEIFMDTSVVGFKAFWDRNRIPPRLISITGQNSSINPGFVKRMDLF